MSQMKCESCELKDAEVHAVAPDGAILFLCIGCEPAEGQGWVVTELDDDEKAPF